MGTRGRESLASLTVVSPLRIERLEPPRDLTPSQAELWRSVIATKPADWFQPDSAPVLYEYCRAKSAADFIASQIDRFQPECMKDEGGFRLYVEMLKEQREQAKLLTK